MNKDYIKQYIAVFLIVIMGILIGIGLSYTHLIIRIIKSFKNSKINFKVIKERKKFIFNNWAIGITGIVYSLI